MGLHSKLGDVTLYAKASHLYHNEGRLNGGRSLYYSLWRRPTILTRHLWRIDDDAASTTADDREAANRMKEATEKDLANLSGSEDEDSDNWIVDDEGHSIAKNKKRRHVIHDDAWVSACVWLLTRNTSLSATTVCFLRTHTSVAQILIVFNVCSDKL